MNLLPSAACRDIKHTIMHVNKMSLGLVWCTEVYFEAHLSAARLLYQKKNILGPVSLTELLRGVSYLLDEQRPQKRCSVAEWAHGGSVCTLTRPRDDYGHLSILNIPQTVFAPRWWLHISNNLENSGSNGWYAVKALHSCMTALLIELSVVIRF